MRDNDWKIVVALLMYKAFVISATLVAVTEISGWWAFLILFAFIGYSNSSYDDFEKESSSRKEM
jgi:uncharacterized membrane protein YhaH (DUF805 family)